MATLLSVNVNKIATLRNARGGSLPNVVQCARDILEFGASGITVHPRPDGRHIRHQDVFDLKLMLENFSGPTRRPEFNIEGYPSDDFVSLIAEVNPDQCTLVPDAPDVLTSNAGWAIAKNKDFLKSVISQIKQRSSTRVSLFIDPLQWSDSETQALKSTSADRVELYTEAYAKAYSTHRQNEVTETYSRVAKELSRAGFLINAGHDLNLENTAYLISKVPEIAEVSIGHALISEALYLGLKETIHRYLAALK